MSVSILLHWLIVVLSIVIVIFSVQRIGRMDRDTDEAIRWGVVLKTGGATVLFCYHMSAIIFRVEDIDNSVPLILYLVGSVMHRTFDRRRDQAVLKVVKPEGEHDGKPASSV